MGAPQFCWKGQFQEPGILEMPVLACTATLFTTSQQKQAETKDNCGDCLVPERIDESECKTEFVGFCSEPRKAIEVAA